MAALLTSQLLQCLDAVAEANGGAGAGVEPGELRPPRRHVFVLAATNVPSALDPALLRPGRLDRAVFVGPPSRDDRAELFSRLLGTWEATGRLATSTANANGRPTSVAAALSCSSSNSSPLAFELADLSDGFSGADVANVARRAATLAIRDVIGAQAMQARTVGHPGADGIAVIVHPRHLLSAVREVTSC